MNECSYKFFKLLVKSLKFTQSFTLLLKTIAFVNITEIRSSWENLHSSFLLHFYKIENSGIKLRSVKMHS
jgi:hypothetical protein